MNIPKSLLRRAVAALREVAQYEIGVNQANYLAIKGRIQAWEDAVQLDSLLSSPSSPFVPCEDETPPTPKPMHLTANQLIMLLQIYRGTLMAERHNGTFDIDHSHLLRLGLIVRYNETWHETALGAERVRTALQ